MWVPKGAIVFGATVTLDSARFWTILVAGYGFLKVSLTVRLSRRLEGSGVLLDAGPSSEGFHVLRV